MKYEKTEKGNPHNLTINQHCFPSRSIERFSNNDGCVEVHRIIPEKTFKVRPSDSLFTARRVWDQQAESGFMKDIEDKYQKLADKAADGRINRLDSEDNQTITDMYALWNIRFHWSQQSIPDQEVKGIHDVTRKLSKSNQEYLEKNSVIPIRPDFKISGRHIVGINVFRNLDMVREKMQGTKWGIIETKGVEFIVPDKAPQNTIMPLTPLLCFWPKNEYLAINDYDVARINHISVQDSENYYFARNLSCCPISNKIGH